MERSVLFVRAISEYPSNSVPQQRATANSLSIKIGDVIEVFDKNVSGFFSGRSLRDSQVGLFPPDVVKEVKLKSSNIETGVIALDYLASGVKDEEGIWDLFGKKGTQVFGQYNSIVS
jgi:hypothetical protein